METILVLDDDDQVRSALLRMLTRLGYTLIEAQSGPEAIAMLKSYPDEVHLLISDVQLPGISGVTVAKQARDVRPSLKILLVSGGHNGTGSAFLEKPFILSTLALKVRSVLDAPG